MHVEVRARSASPPFFVVGAQRSGSTLVRLMLDHHPQIAVPHEFDYLIEAIPAAGPWPEPAELELRLGESGSFRRSGLRADATLPFPELAEDLLRQHQGTKPLVGMVAHAHFDRIPRIWPEARFVHLLRDPRDVATSVIGMGWAGNVWYGADRWRTAEESWERLRTRVPAGRYVEVRYEDLLAEPARELARICGLLGVRYNDAMLAYDRDTTYRAPDASLATQWRGRLSRRQVQLVEARVGRLLVSRGYAPSGEPALAVGALDRAWLRADDWTGRMRFRIRRFGLGLFAADVVARKLRLAPVERRLQARIRRIADRYVK